MKTTSLKARYMRLKTFTLIFFIIFFSISALIAQKNVVKGYVVTQGGEKLEGFFNTNELDVYSRVIAFSTNKKFKDFEVFQANEVKEFTIDEYYIYRSFSVEFDYQTKTGRSFKYEGNRNLRLVTGTEKLGLYELADLDMRAWFIKKEGQPITFLTVTKKLNTPAVDMLKSAIADCSCIAFDDTLPTKVNHVQEVIEEYNEFINSPIINENTTAVKEHTTTSHEE